MRKFFRYLLVTVLIFPNNVFAQVDYPVFKYGTDIQPADSQQLSLHIYNLNYLYNTEFFGNIPLSGTLFGYEFIPELQYQVSPRFILKAGIYLQQEFGRPHYTTVAPTFTAKYQMKHASFIIGTLEGGMNHEFIEPIYDYKLLINERLENGFQTKVNTNVYTHDLYLNWRKAIHPGDPFKEEFDVGYSAKLIPVNTKKWKVTLPFQFIYSHKGGQYDALNEPLTSLINFAPGVGITYKHNGRILNKIQFDNYYVNYRDISGQKRQPFKTGNAFLSHLWFDLNNFGIDIRYWNGMGYIGPRGMPLFQSVSEKYPGLVEKHRELIIMSFIFNKELAKNLYFNFRMTPYKDLIEKMTSGTGLEYYYEMYLKYVMKINLGKVKNNL